MAQDKGITAAEQLISMWGDQNHTVTELFMVLNRLVRRNGIYLNAVNYMPLFELTSSNWL